MVAAAGRRSGADRPPSRTRTGELLHVTFRAGAGHDRAPTSSRRGGRSRRSAGADWPTRKPAPSCRVVVRRSAWGIVRSWPGRRTARGPARAPHRDDGLGQDHGWTRTSAETGWPYVDNDDLLRRQTGREPAEILATEGEDVLHLAESDALDEALGMAPPTSSAWRRRPSSIRPPGRRSGKAATSSGFEPARRRSSNGSGRGPGGAAMPPITTGSGSGPVSAKRCMRPSPRRSSTSTAARPAEIAGEVLEGLEGS